MRKVDRARAFCGVIRAARGREFRIRKEPQALIVVTPGHTLTGQVYIQTLIPTQASEALSDAATPGVGVPRGSPGHLRRGLPRAQLLQRGDKAARLAS